MDPKEKNKMVMYTELNLKDKNKLGMESDPKETNELYRRIGFEKDKSTRYQWAPGFNREPSKKTFRHV